MDRLTLALAFPDLGISSSRANRNPEDETRAYRARFGVESSGAVSCARDRGPKIKPSNMTATTIPVHFPRQDIYEFPLLFSPITIPKFSCLLKKRLIICRR